MTRGELITFEAGFPDAEFPYITCSIWGATNSNEIFVKLSNGTVSVVESAESPVLYPKMADRLFGIDVLDSQLAEQLADRLWERHKGDLIISPKT